MTPAVKSITFYLDFISPYAWFQEGAWQDAAHLPAGVQRQG